MSKFEGMSQAASGFKQRWSEHQERCIEAAAKFITGFREYCSIPMNGLSFVPVTQENRRAGTVYSLPGAIELKEDFWWHLGLVINLSGGEKVLLELCFSEDKTGTIVRLGSKGSPHQLSFNDPVSLHRLYEAMVNKVVNFYSTDPRERSIPPGRVGFEYVDLAKD